MRERVLKGRLELFIASGLRTLEELVRDWRTEESVIKNTAIV